MNIGSKLKKEPDVEGFFNYLETPEARKEIEDLLSALPLDLSKAIRNEFEAAVKNRDPDLFCILYKVARGYIELDGKKE